MMRRSRPLLVVAGLLVAGLIMLAWTQTWFTLRLTPAAAVTASVTADGSVAASAYSALAIASLAVFLALTIAGRILRVVLAVIEILLGVAVVATGVTALADPIAAAASSVGSVAGVSDLHAVRAVVANVAVSLWPYVGIGGGVLAVALGVVVLLVQRRWPGPSRRYSANGGRSEKPMADVPRDAVIDWDDLSAGVDPTGASAPTGVEVTAAAARGGASSRDASTIGSETRRQTGDTTESEEHREHH